MAERNKASVRPTCTFDGTAYGARLMLALIPGMTAFGLAVGATSAAKGFSFAETLLMNGLVYAGASQLVAMEVWPDRLTVAAIAAIALVTATVNARMLLMGASLQPWLAPLPPWQVYPLLYLITDPGWLIAMRYRAGGGNDVGVFLGGGLTIWTTWMASSSAGYLLGAVIANPRALGLDLIMPIFFASMLIPMWAGRRRAVAWIVAGVVALACDWLGFGWWCVVAGAFAGALTEALSDG